MKYIKELTCVGGLAVALQVCVANGSIDSLGPEGKRAYLKHQDLFENVVKAYNCSLETQVNAQYKTLRDITFFSETKEFDGEQYIPIPADLRKHVTSFQLVIIEGDGLLKSEADFFSSRGRQGSKPWRHTNNRIELRAGDANFNEGFEYGLKFFGKGSITKITLHSAGGVSAVFDTAPFFVPGLNKPVKNIDVSFDVTKLRSIGGINKLKRERYFRAYMAPNSERSGKEPYLRGKGFLPGRQIEKLGPAFEDRYGAADRMSYLKEDVNRPGYADLSFFDRKEFWRFEGVDPDLEFVMCFDSWPKFMHPKGVDHIVNSLGTPDNYDAAAELAAAYLKAQIRDSGRTANWWEVKNESDVQSEWMWHWKDGYDSWGMLIDFHKTMANKIHKEVPGVKIGGPTSAWIQPHRSEFKIWANHKRFMKETKGSLDFYSHHFYEIASLDTYSEQWNDRDSYSQGGVECTLDLVQAQMVNQNNSKPVVISEYGTLNAPRAERAYWMHIKNINNLLMDFFQRPQELEITVPFLLGFMHWDPDATETLFHQTPDGEYVKTPNTYWIDMWTDYRGKRIVSNDSDRKVFTHAVIDGDVVRIAINNRTGQRALCNVSAVLPDGVKIVSATAKKAFYGGGETRYADESVTDLTQLPLGVGGTVIVTVQLSGEPVARAMCNETMWYAPETAVKVDSAKSAVLTVNVDKDVLGEARKARIRVGVNRDGGFDTSMVVKVNGHKLPSVDLRYSKGINRLLDYFEIPVEPSFLTASNKVEVSFGEQDGFVSAVKVILVSEESVK